MERQWRLLPLAVLMVLASLFAGSHAEYRPVVLLHGLASDSSVMETLKGWIQADFPGTTPCPRLCWVYAARVTFARHNTPNKIFDTILRLIF